MTQFLSRVAHYHWDSVLRSELIPFSILFSIHDWPRWWSYFGLSLRGHVLFRHFSHSNIFCSKWYLVSSKPGWILLKRQTVIWCTLWDYDILILFWRSTGPLHYILYSIASISHKTCEYLVKMQVLNNCKHWMMLQEIFSEQHIVL